MMRMTINGREITDPRVRALAVAVAVLLVFLLLAVLGTALVAAAAIAVGAAVAVGVARAVGLIGGARRERLQDRRETTRELPPPHDSPEH